jgi:hypothetical protein
VTRSCSATRQERYNEPEDERVADAGTRAEERELRALKRFFEHNVQVVCERECEGHEGGQHEYRANPLEMRGVRVESFLKASVR